MGEIISFTAGIFLLIICLMVMKRFWPQSWDFSSAAFVLTFAVFLGFVSDGFNTLWWQILGTINREFFGFENFQAVGLYLDGLFKGLAAFAGVLHLIAVRKQLPENERDNYWWFEMPWYPRKLIGRKKDG